MSKTEMQVGLKTSLAEIVLKHGNVRGLRGQKNSHGVGDYSFNVFVPDTKLNRRRFPGARVVTTGSLTVI
jgi:hypothetical protein